MLTEFILKKLKNARHRRLGDGSYFAEIPGVRGVWANARTLAECRRELREVLEDWLLLKVYNRDRVPGFNVKIDQRRLVRHA